MAREHNLALLRTESFLNGNQARNAVLPFVDTEYVAFVDYDTQPSAGWLERLERCADDTGASVVAPLLFERDSKGMRLHMAGGENHVVERGGRRWLVEGSHQAVPAPSVGAYATENVDVHCVLVRRDVFETVGPFDERLPSLRDHSDLCLAVRARGGTVYVETSARATYEKPRGFRRADRHFWLVRWSDAWNQASLDRFQAKWQLSADDPTLPANMTWARAHRRLCYRPWTSIAGRVSDRLMVTIVDRVDPPLQRFALTLAAARTAAAGPVRLVHRPMWVSRLHSPTTPIA
jgi:GT2 family glycosyltransferase